MEKYINNKGSSLILVTLLLPIFLILTGMIIDGGRLYLINAKLQSIADASANAGASAAGDVLVNEGETLSAVLSSGTPQAVAENYIELNNETELAFKDTTIIYPYDYQNGDSSLSVKVIITYNVPMYFTNIIGIENVPLEVETISTIQL